MGHQFSILEDYQSDPLNYESIKNRLPEEPFDYIIWFLVIPTVSDICEKLSVNYIFWNYDSPLMSLFHPSIYNQPNYTFIFNYTKYNYLHERNAPNIFHLPLVVN